MESMPCRKRDILHSLITSKVKDERAMQQYGDNKKMLQYCRKELYWEVIIEQGVSIVDGLQTSWEALPSGFVRFCNEQRSTHIHYAFSEICKELKSTKEGGALPEEKYTAHRLVYRYVNLLLYSLYANNFIFLYR